jgi:DNA-binding LacI/PurR family transcriptional regulator
VTAGPGPRGPNIRDVARAAGVSHQTVSRVLNDAPNLLPSTRRRVLAAIDRLGYRPNQAARALGTNRSGLIGVLVVWRAAAYGHQTLLYAIEDAARVAGYRTGLVTCSGEPGSVHAAVEQLLDQAAEAVVLVVPQARVLEVLTADHSGLPLVVIDSQRHAGACSVSADQVEGARLATRHLVRLGHTRIVHLAGPGDRSEAVGRARGYREEMIAEGLDPRPPVPTGWTADSGYRAGRVLLDAADVTAVFCSNDETALGLLHAVRDSGLRVPDDLSVVGFDDIPEAAHYAPPLTTVRQDFAAIGRRAVELVISRLAGPTASSVETIRPHLVLRASTAPPRA